MNATRHLGLIAALAIASVFPAAGTASGPGDLPQTAVLPSASAPAFEARMRALWQGIVAGNGGPAMPAFFPRSAYVQVKAISNPVADYRDRLLANFSADVRAAYDYLGRGGRATFVSVRVPHQWSWIAPGGCYNRVGYWHAPGSRLVYRQGGRIRSFGVYSLISWRGEWYVVHLAGYDTPGTVLDPASGAGAFGPPGGC